MSERSQSDQPRSNGLSAVPFDSLLSFLESLRPEIVVGVDQILSTQQLLLRLAERGALSDDLSVLRSYIRPIVCRNREEQAHFDERFRIWLETVGPPAIAPMLPSSVPPPEVVAARWRRYTWSMLVTLSLLMAGAAWWQTPPPAPTPKAPLQQTVQDAGVEVPAVKQELGPKPIALELSREKVQSKPVLPFTLPGLRVFLLLAMTLAALLWLSARVRAWWEARRFLARAQHSLPKGLNELRFGFDPALLRDPDLRALATSLRRREDATQVDVDVPATVSQTARAAGRLVVVTKPRRRLPDYLALIERAHLEDVQARFFDHWLDHLTHQDVSIRRCYFADPRVTLGSSGREAPVLLSELCNVTAGHRVWLFSDGERLMNPSTGHPRAVVNELEPWVERALITPESPDWWGAREQALTAKGLSILPATPLGLAASRDKTGTPVLAALAPPQLPLPRMLVEREREWLLDDSPSAEDRAFLSSQLRSYLGDDGLLWLSACALYGQVRFSLVASLGVQLGVHTGRSIFNRETLLRLARLPWLRNAYMPEWLRETLFYGLSTAERRLARAALRCVLLEAAAPGTEAVALELATQGDGPLRSVWRMLTARLQKSADSDDPVRDRVFQKWMREGVGIWLPAELGRRLQAKAQRVEQEGTRPAPHPVVSMCGALLVHVGVLILFVCLAFAATVLSLGTIESGLAKYLIGLLPLIGSALTLPRWEYVSYSPDPRRGTRMVLDAVAPPALCMVLILAVRSDEESLLANAGLLGIPLRNYLWGHLVALLWAVLRALSMERPRNRLAGASAPRTALHALTLLVERWLPASLLHSTGGRATSAVSYLQSALLALLIAPATGGWALPLYALLMPVRYLGRGVWEGLARALIETSLSWLPMLIGVTTPRYGLPVVAWSLSAYPISLAYCVVLFSLAFETRRTLDVRRVYPWMRLGRNLLRSAAWLDANFPDRWFASRSGLVPALACLLGLLYASLWRPNDHAFTWLAQQTAHLPGWPIEDNVEPDWTFRPGPVDKVAFDLNGRLFVLTSGGDLIRDAKGTPMVRRLDENRAISDDARCVLSGREYWVDDVQNDITEDPTRPPFETPWHEATFSRSCETVVLFYQRQRLTDHGYVRLMSLEDESQFNTVDDDGQRFLVLKLKLSPNGADLLVLAPDGLRFLNVIGTRKTFERLSEEPPSSDDAFAFSPDSKTIAAGFSDGTVRVWKSGALDKPLELGTHRRAVETLAFNADGSRLVSATIDGAVRLWATDGSLPSRSLSGHTDRVTTARFTPDDQWVITGSWDGTVRLWSMNDEGESVVLLAGPSRVTSVTVSPRDQQIAAASEDGVVRSWSVFRSVGSAQSSELPEPTAPEDAGSDAAVTVPFIPDAGTRTALVNGGDQSATSGQPRNDAVLSRRDADLERVRQLSAPTTERAPIGRVNNDQLTYIRGNGEIETETVIAQFKMRLRAIQICYEQQLRREPELQGKVVVEFTIEEVGIVSNVRATSNTSGDPEVAACVVDTARRLRFRPGPSGGSVSYSMPFVFAPAQ